MLRIILAILALSSYAHGADPVPAELAGSWTLSEGPVRKLPSECRNSRLVFTSDGKLIALNGELRFVTKISVKRRNDGFAVHQDFLEHNSKPTAKANLPNTCFLVLFMTFTSNGMALFYGNTFGQKKLDDSSNLFVREAPNPRLKTDVEKLALKLAFFAMA